MSFSDQDNPPPVIVHTRTIPLPSLFRPGQLPCVYTWLSITYVGYDLYEQEYKSSDVVDECKDEVGDALRDRVRHLARYLEKQRLSCPHKQVGTDVCREYHSCNKPGLQYLQCLWYREKWEKKADKLKHVHVHCTKVVFY